MISLVLATYNRVHELERFLNSLKQQTMGDFELIIVDQNEDNRLEPVVSQFTNSFAIKHFRSTKGLSKSRNVGLQYVDGDIIGFPDDDCWYESSVLDEVQRRLQDSKLDGMTGITLDSDGTTRISNFDKSAGYIDRFNVWNRGVSITIFLRKTCLDSIGMFDEELGAGSKTPWQSGEETDLLIRAALSGAKIYYNPTFVVGHPNPTVHYDDFYVKKASKYAMGFGRVLRKHNYPLWFVLKYFLRPFIGAVLASIGRNRGKRRLYMAVLKGRILGWVAT